MHPRAASGNISRQMKAEATDATTRRAPQKMLRSDMTVRQVARDFPACREVLVQHGEPADRQPFGHLEPLDRFAARHQVPLEALLGELSKAAGLPIDRVGIAAEHVHRPFLVMSLAMTLTIGAGWGAWILWQIGLNADFSAAPVSHIVAHGDAQLWGFVTLFVMGIALRWLPVATAAQPVPVVWAVAILGNMFVGIASGFTWELCPASLPFLATLSGVALLLAALLFALFLVRCVADRLNQAWSAAVTASACWLIVWAAFTCCLRIALRDRGPDDYSWAQRNWSIELAVFGVALNAVYGFGLRLLPGMVGGPAKRRRTAVAVGLHNIGMLLLPWSLISARAVFEPIGLLCIACGTIAFVAGLPGLTRVKTFSKRPEQGAAGLSRFVQLAFFWLLVGALLLAVGQVHALLTGDPLPHAWRGAARHALTVGFLTTLIMGVAQRLLPILGHTLLAWPRLVMPMLLLVGTGNLLRVGTELATLMWPAAFSLMPFSAMLEVSALALFTANCLRTLWPRPDPLLVTGRVTPRSSVAVLLAENPWIEDELIAAGFSYLARARAVPKELTIESLSRSSGLDPNDVVERINRILASQSDRARRHLRRPSQRMRSGHGGES